MYSWLEARRQQQQQWWRWWQGGLLAHSPFPAGRCMSGCLLDTGHPSQLLLGEREGVRERGGWQGGEEGGTWGCGGTDLADG